MPQPLPPATRTQVLRPQPKIHNPIALTKKFMDDRAKLTRGEFEAGQRKAVLGRFEKIEEEQRDQRESLDQIKDLLTEVLGQLKKNKE